MRQILFAGATTVLFSIHAFSQIAGGQDLLGGPAGVRTSQVGLFDLGAQKPGVFIHQSLADSQARTRRHHLDEAKARIEAEARRMARARAAGRSGMGIAGSAAANRQ